jgi:hypothetical protein
MDAAFILTASVLTSISQVIHAAGFHKKCDCANPKKYELIYTFWHSRRNTKSRERGRSEDRDNNSIHATKLTPTIN